MLKAYLSVPAFNLAENVLDSLRLYLGQSSTFDCFRYVVIVGVQEFLPIAEPLLNEVKSIEVRQRC